MKKLFLSYKLRIISYKWLLFVFITYNSSFITNNCYAQDSTNQKHPLFKVSGVTVLGGGFVGIGNFNETYNSKANLQSIWPAFASKPHLSLRLFS
ncbi:MAG: hypothetical protein ACYDEC_03650 [Bacteroidia bacterium]